MSTITDYDGNFILEIFTNSDLEVSYMGYKAQTINPKGKEVCTVHKGNQKLFDEVVVVGYGTEKKSQCHWINCTGLSGHSFPNDLTCMLLNALAGQMAGVTVINVQDSFRSELITNRVRGVSSFGGDKSKADALVLIDGIPGNMNDVRHRLKVSLCLRMLLCCHYGARA